MDNALFIDGHKNIGKNELKAAVKSLGVDDNDVLFVHSDVSVFGKLATFNRSFILDSFIEALQESVPNGSLILPTFTYSFCRGEKFSVKNSKSTVGALTEHFRKKKDVLRTNHPIFSVAIWGKQDGFLNISKDCFDRKSIFGKLYKKDAKLLFLGAPFQSCTYMHYVEQMFKVPYRYMKTFKGKISNGTEYEDEYTYFVRYLDSNVDSAIEKAGKHLLDNGFMKKKRLGSGEILLIEAKVLYREIFKLLKKDIFYLLKERPDMKKFKRRRC